MTVINQSSRSDAYNTDGVTRNWPFQFRVIDAADINIVITDALGFTETITSGIGLIRSSNASVEGGTAVYPAAPSAPLPSGYTVEVVRNTPVKQPTKFVGAAYSGEASERSADRLVMLIQELRRYYDDAFDALYREGATTFPIPISKGGTGATTIEAVKQALGLDAEIDPEKRAFLFSDYTDFDIDDYGVSVQFGPNATKTASLGGAPQFDAFRAMVSNLGPTNQCGQVTAVTGVIRGRVNNKVPGGNNGFSVGGFFNATCEVNGGTSWGINPVVADYGPDASGTAPWIDEPNTSGRVLEGAEIDVNVAHTSTVAIGVNLIGNFLTNKVVSPTFGFICDVNGSLQAPWAQGYTTAAGGAVDAFVVGQKSKGGNNIDSQTATFRYFSSNGSDLDGKIILRASAWCGTVFSFEGQQAGVLTPNLFLPSGGQIQFRNSGGSGAPVQFAYSDNANTVHLGTNTNQFRLHTDILPDASKTRTVGSRDVPFNKVSAVVHEYIPVNFAELPNPPAMGMRAIIKDGTTNTYGAPVGGGGTTFTPVFYADVWRVG